jgi:hypothetical protein
MKLVVTKPLTYGTRHMVAGDVFEPQKKNHGVALLASKKVKKLPARRPGKIAPPPAELAAKVRATPEEELSALRAEYADRIGRRPFAGWDAATLRAKIDAA